MSFVDAFIVDLDGSYLAVPQPPGWQAIDIEGDWSAEVASLVRAKATTLLDAGEANAVDRTAPEVPEEASAEAEAWAVALVGDALRDILADVEPAAVVVGIEVGADGAAVLSVLGVAVLAEGESFDAIVSSTIEAFQADPEGGPMAIDRADLPERSILRVVAGPAGDVPADGHDGPTSASLLVHLLATGTVVLLLGTAAGPGSGVMVDVWSDLASELNAVTAELPGEDQLIEGAP